MAALNNDKLPKGLRSSFTLSGDEQFFSRLAGLLIVRRPRHTEDEFADITIRRSVQDKDRYYPKIRSCMNSPESSGEFDIKRKRKHNPTVIVARMAMSCPSWDWASGKQVMRK